MIDNLKFSLNLSHPSNLVNNNEKRITHEDTKPGTISSLEPSFNELNSLNYFF